MTSGLITSASLAALALGAIAAAAQPAAAAATGSQQPLYDGVCPLFRHDFEHIDNVFWQGFEGEGHLAPGSGGGASIIYTSSGGYTLRVDRHTITVTDPLGRNKVEHWGDPHENLNGKHIKDWGGAAGWDGSRRTILLGDATKLTMSASGAQGLTLHTSIYDGRQELHIDNTGNLVLHHGFNSGARSCREQAQHDGETARFHTETDTGIASYTNIYNEDATFTTTTFDVPLGRTGGFANPNQVNDYFDDPRLGHT